MVCREAKDLARCLIFIIETKRKADPHINIFDIYEMMLRSMRYGNVICYDNEHGVAVGMVSYTIGTLEAEYEDTDTVHVEYCLMEPGLQGSFYFLKCLQFFMQTIVNEHPGVEWMTMRAYDKVKRNNRLYSKFAQKTGQIQGEKGTLNVYKTHIKQLQAYLQRLSLSSSFGRR
jgi:hypothetical protein